MIKMFFTVWLTLVIIAAVSAYRDLGSGCGGSCSQGRKKCDCKK